MTEHTDKSPQKPGRTPPRKRAGKARSPDGKRAMRPNDKLAGEKLAGEKLAAPDTALPAAGTDSAPESRGEARGDVRGDARGLAPDPATIVFGTTRPIAAAPAKLPESSGLRFSGPSAGLLKASGPQPTSPKASGLTFSSAATSAAPAKMAAAKAGAAKPAAVAEAAKPAAVKKPEGQPAEARKPDKPALTKPAIAPQASGRHFDKERSAGGLVAMMLALGVVGGGLALWIELGNDTVVPPAQPAAAPAAAEAPSAAPEAGEAAVVVNPSPRAPESPGPLAGDSVEGELTAAEIDEVQRLLVRLDFDPGSQAGVVTAETAAAIRSYQEMAGLPADGEADRPLLEELRSVAELYGG